MATPRLCTACGQWAQTSDGACDCHTLKQSWEVYKVPIPMWMNKPQQNKFASKHIAMQKGDGGAAREIDEMFESLIKGYKFVNELAEE